MIPDLTILQGDWIEQLRALPDCSVHCCVTSPPYWGLRDYGVAGQLGLEKTPEEYVAKMVEGFREVRRVLRDDGTLWLNLGDTYASQGGSFDPADWDNKQSTNRGSVESIRKPPPGLKPKDLVGIPWMVAFALRQDGWYLRSDIIWHKPNPMPESVTDRPTKSHEYIFLMSKRDRYYYDAEAIKEVGVIPAGTLAAKGSEERFNTNGVNSRPPEYKEYNGFRNKRSVWTIATNPYREAHFATFPPALIKPCILAGTSAKGCCPHCGAPWEREVNRVPSTSKSCPKTQQAHVARGGTGEPVGTVGKSGSGRIDGYTETLGWYPSCRCNNDEDDIEVDPIPCTVLDPFAGSGTTGQVAMELGRSVVLIELNPKYVELLRHRTNTTAGFALT